MGGGNKRRGGGRREIERERARGLGDAIVCVAGDCEEVCCSCSVGFLLLLLLLLLWLGVFVGDCVR